MLAPRVLAACLVLAGSTATALAQSNVDTVFRKSGGKAGGTITEIERTAITVSKQVGGDETVPATDVAYVQWAGEPLEMKTGRAAENAGRLPDALAAYEEALAKAEGDVKTDLEFLTARVAAKLALTDTDQLDAAIEKLKSFQTTHADSFRYYQSLALLGEAQLAKEDYAAANATFDELQQAPTKEVQMAARNAKARVLLAQGMVDQALSAYESVIAENAATPVETSRRYEAMLGKADCLRRQQNFDPAIETLETVVKETAETETELQARAFLLKGDCYREMNRPKDALFAYLHVDLLFASEPSLHAEALSHLVDLWKQAGRPDRAAATLATLKEKYPNSPLAQQAGG